MFRFKFPKNDARFAWTNHIKNKMLFYGLSEQKIKSVLQSPKRKEEGIAPDTVAAMQSSRGKKKPEEIWVMYRKTNNLEPITNNSSKLNVRSLKSSRILMISAWRYPGITKPGQKPLIPQEILDELESDLARGETTL